MALQALPEQRAQRAPQDWQDQQVLPAQLVQPGQLERLARQVPPGLPDQRVPQD
jgi:hypothetical protein